MKGEYWGHHFSITEDAAEKSKSASTLLGVC